MKIKRIHRITALSLALIVLVSSSGLTMDMHYCMGHLKNVNFFGKAKTCHDKVRPIKNAHCKKIQKACHQKFAVSQSQKANGCCDNHSIQYDLDTEFIQSSFDILVGFDYQSLSINNFSARFFESSNIVIPAFLLYKPPIPERDIPVLIQSFLI